MWVYLPKWLLAVLAVVVVIGGVVAVAFATGRFGSDKTTTVFQAGSAGATGAAGSSPTTSPNDAVIEHAQQSPAEQAQAGQASIRATLTDKLGMKPNGDFNLPGPFSCYVKTGVEAKNFAYMRNHILYGPNGTDLIFVQTDTTTPLSKCLIAVRHALGW